MQTRQRVQRFSKFMCFKGNHERSQQQPKTTPNTRALQKLLHDEGLLAAGSQTDDLPRAFARCKQLFINVIRATSADTAGDVLLVIDRCHAITKGPKDSNWCVFHVQNLNNTTGPSKGVKRTPEHGGNLPPTRTFCRLRCKRRWVCGTDPTQSPNNQMN